MSTVRESQKTSLFQFPATITTEGNQWTRAIASLREGVFKVVTEPGRAAVVANAYLTGVRKTGFRTWAIDTDQGTFHVKREGSCGCTHPLKRVTAQQVAEYTL